MHANETAPLFCPDTSSHLLVCFRLVCVILLFGSGGAPAPRRAPRLAHASQGRSDLLAAPVDPPGPATFDALRAAPSHERLEHPHAQGALGPRSCCIHRLDPRQPSF
jgi:hypothetical protein